MFKAESTETTLCNITNHIYLNLSNDTTIDNHQFDIQADRYLNIDDLNRVLSIDHIEKPFVFDGKQTIKPLFDIMSQTPFDGFDHTFLLHKQSEYDFKAIEKDLTLTVNTTYPSIVLYTHNNLAPYALRGQKPKDNKHIAFTIECQYEPGGIQVEGLHDAVLNPGEIYEQDMILTFDVTKKV
jgi:aldose 1-epimerase